MSAEELLSTIAAFDWHSGAYEKDPIGSLKALAGEGWIARTELGYAILSKEQARPFLKADLPISLYHIPSAVSPYLAERTQKPLLTRHGPEHARLRSILTRVLRSHVIEELRPEIRTVFDGLLDKVIARGESDLVRDLFNPYPAHVLAPMLGIPYSDVDMVAEWVTISAKWTNILNPQSALADIESAWRKLEGYLLELLSERRRHLSHDVFSELIREMGDSEEEEVVGIAAELTRAGVDTTRRQLACTMHALLENPIEWRRLSDDPDLASKAVEEGMRYAPIIHAISRQAITASEIGGVKADGGTVFTVMAMAANRDPAAYEEPNRFDLTRSPCPHLTFGAGSHACVGAPLARMEMGEAFKSLAQRIEAFELVGEVTRSEVSEGWVPQNLPVTVIPRDR